MQSSALPRDFIPVASGDCDEICRVGTGQRGPLVSGLALNFFRSSRVAGGQAGGQARQALRVECILPLTLHSSGTGVRDRPSGDRQGGARGLLLWAQWPGWCFPSTPGVSVAVDAGSHCVL